MTMYSLWLFCWLYSWSRTSSRIWCISWYLAGGGRCGRGWGVGREGQGACKSFGCAGAGKRAGPGAGGGGAGTTAHRNAQRQGQQPCNARRAARIWERGAPAGGADVHSGH